ncbi:MAG: M48 family metallopeptidase [Alphaproteobacteria bacterium]|nr:M48 family metallopeptidase [Alphaproteobacteria bacterium]
MKHIFLIALVICSLISSQVSAQGIIRDTELETAVKKWSEPLIIAAGLSPKSVNIIFVQDSGINAFVAGGSNIFIYTGLIEKADNPQELLGVIAHELGHISGGHLIRTHEALRNASYETMLGTILGVGAAIVSGNAGAAGAVSTAANLTAQRKFLSYSRSHESSADQAALSFLKTAKIDPEGLVSFFGKLQDQDLLPQSQQLEYVRTHPLTRNRIDAIKIRAESSPLFKTGMSKDKKETFNRLKGKLTGFINPQHVEWTYSQTDTSITALYARSISNYRLHKKEEALKGVDKLLNLEPNNPYFLELKGQMLVDFGDIKEALPYYKKAIQNVSEPALIRTAYAHALIESTESNPAILKEAISELKKAYLTEPKSLRIQRLLGTAYGRLGQEGKANVHLAEEAILKGQNDYAKQRINKALKHLDNGSTDWFHAQDILNLIKQREES